MVLRYRTVIPANGLSVRVTENASRGRCETYRKTVNTLIVCDSDTITKKRYEHTRREIVETTERGWSVQRRRKNGVSTRNSTSRLKRRRLAVLLGGSTDDVGLLADDGVVVSATVSATSASSSVVQEDVSESTSSSVVQEDESESVVGGERDLQTGRQTWWLTPSILARVLPRRDSFSSETWEATIFLV
jgi:hypothetical protein